MFFLIRLFSFSMLSDFVEGSVFLCIFFFLCVFICCAYSLALCGGKELGHILYSAECSCIYFKYLFSVNETCTDPWSCNQTNVFWGGGILSFLIWNWCMWSILFEEVLKKAVFCGNSHIPQWYLLKTSPNRLAINSSRYLQTPERACFVLCILSDCFIYKYMV